MMMKRFLVLFGLFVFPVTAVASGFMIPEQGAKAVGFGNAFAAIADDPSANWFNPAGIAFQDNAVMVSGDLIAPTNKYTDPATGRGYDAKKTVFLVPQIYANYRAADSKLTYGLAINAPFGLSTDWSGSGAPFAQVAAGVDSVTFSQIEAVHINPNVAYTLDENFSIAAGITYYNASKIHLDNQAVKIGGHGDGFGFNAALMYRTGPVSLGIGYRSKVKIDVKGTAVGGPALAIFGLQGVGSNASTSVTFPDLANIALAYHASDSWLLTAQVDWINWKTFDQIIINFAPSQLNLATGSSATVPENWKATFAYRLGAEWKLGEANRLRFGYVFDPTPINNIDFSPRLPGNDRQLLSLGYGTDVNAQVTVDLAYAYVWLKNRTMTTAATPIFNGRYKSYTHILAADLVYRF